MTQGRKPDVMLLSHGRTLSNLFCKMMSKQDGFDFGEYHFHDAFMTAHKTFNDKALIEYPDADREEFYRQLKEGYDKLMSQMDEAHEKGRPVFFKNHVSQTIEPARFNQLLFGGDLAPTLKLTSDDDKHTNPTLLSDETLLSFVPIFIIRHPVLQNESWYRAITRCAPVDLKNNWTKNMGDISSCRKLLEWYDANVPKDVQLHSPARPGPFAPIVLDCDDLLEDNRAVIEEVCARCNFDPAKVIDQWDEQAPREDLGVMSKSFLKDLNESKGVDKSKSSKGVNMDQKHKEWTEKWGVEAADYLKKCAENAMDDYEYMKSRRLTVLS